MKTLIIFWVSAGIFFLISCKEDSTEPTNEIKKITITHWGVDWSEGKVGSQNLNLDYNVVDGETVSWCAYGSMSTTNNGVWFRPYVDKLKKINISDLNSASLADTTNWSTDVCSTPLQNGDLWLAKCRDGYVVFKVLKQPSVSVDFWPVEVEYRFFKRN